MKRNLSGEDAYLKMITTPVPEKTDSYSPIRHQDIFLHIRKEVMNAGFIIVGEDYKCTADSPKNPGGQVALGIMQIKFKADPELVLVATFMNSYNKQYAFRFALGAQVSVRGGAFSGNTIMLENDIHGFYRRVHTGQAEILATGTISELIQGAEDYWNLLVDHKNKLQKIDLTWEEQHHILGMLFLRRDLITTFQLNIIKKEITTWENNNPGSDMDAWTFYNCVAAGIADTHPAEWMDVHARVHNIFNDQLHLDPPALPGADPEPEVEEDDDDQDLTAMATAAGTGDPDEEEDDANLNTGFGGI